MAFGALAGAVFIHCRHLVENTTAAKIWYKNQSGIVAAATPTAHNEKARLTLVSRN
jgi:hypothetical protein